MTSKLEPTAGAPRAPAPLEMPTTLETTGDLIRFGPEQGMLADIATRFCRDRWNLESTRQQIETEHGFDRELWTEIAELGWAGIAIPEEYGGAGQGLAEVVPIVEAMGRRLFAGPFVPCQLAAQVLMAGGSEEQKDTWLSKITTGSIATVAVVEPDGSWHLQGCHATATAEGGTAQPGERWTLAGDKCFVLDADSAELIVVTVAIGSEIALGLLSRAEVPAGALEREVVIDETRRSYRLRLDGITIDRGSLIRGDDARRALRALRNAALLLVSAEACGGLAGTLDLVVAYLGSRQQFGRLIGSYQALKHPTVDILIGLERARSHLYHAATLTDGPSNEGSHAEAIKAEIALRMAKAEASDSFAFASDRAIQFHGGFGFTYECDAQLFLRRALWCQYQFGDAAHHRKHLAPLLLG